MNKLNLLADKIILYGIAISMVITSVGISFSLIRGSEFNVEALNTKLELSGIANKNKRVTEELKQVTEEIKKAPLSPQTLSEIKEIDEELENTEQEIIEIEEKFIEKVEPSNEKEQSEEYHKREEVESN